MSARREQFIEALAGARAEGRQITTPDPSWTLNDKHEGIGIMLEVARRLGWPRLGWKIAATNPALQKKLRTDEPVFGMTFQRFLKTSPASLSRSRLLDPVIECEFAFRIGKDLDRARDDYSFDEIADSIDAVFLCIEVAECRYPHNRLPSPLHIMADGFASGWYILGDEIPDWRRAFTAGVRVTLHRNGQPHSSGSSHDVMGHPLKPVVWLANTLHQYGHALRAGDLVSSGSCNILCKGTAETEYVAVYDGFGSVRLALS